MECSIPDCTGSVTAWGWCNTHYRRWARHGDPLVIKVTRAPRGEVTAYLRAHLGEEGEDCLLWPYGTSYGYGVVTIGKRQYRVHQLACEHRWGPMPEPGMQAAHLPVVCHDPLCFRGAHVRWASARENGADRQLDGTNISRWAQEGTVLAIREEWAAGGVSQVALGRKYGINPQAVHGIVHRKTWVNL